MATAVETTKTFMNVLKNYSQDTSQIGLTALDEAVRTSTGYDNLSAATTHLKKLLADTETYPDTDTRLREATGMILSSTPGTTSTADTGAISGSNAGGSTVKNARDIVPEDGDLSTAQLPTPGSTSQITYTGNDGKSFSFYVKWPDNFNTVINGTNITTDEEAELAIYDKRYLVDLSTLDPNGYYTTTSDGDIPLTMNSNTYGNMLASIQLILKGLNSYWLKEGAKLNYDSLGLALDGQTIEIAFIAGGKYDDAAAITFSRREDYLPSNYITLSINLNTYGNLDSTNANGLAHNLDTGDEVLFLDRVVAHEMVHAVMMTTGTFKNGMPQFFTEGIADLVQGDDDEDQFENMQTLVAEPKTLEEALVFTPGTGSTYAYPAGDMFMRFLAKQSLNTTTAIGNSAQAETFSYAGNEMVISNYSDNDTINYQATIGSVRTNSTLNDLVIDAASDANGQELIVRDVRGKLVTLTTPTGTAYSFMAPIAGEINGTLYNNGGNYQIIFGADYADNILHAGNAGSMLWGGMRGNDELFGGNGADVFIYQFDGGTDTVHNAESQDRVELRNMSISQLSYANITDGGVNFGFTDGKTLNVEGQASLFTVTNDDATFNFRADYQNKTWSQA